MPELERLHRRPAVSCTLCRKRKIRCNREAPCSACIRSRSESCIYDTHSPLSSRQRREQVIEVHPLHNSTNIHPPAPVDQRPSVYGGLSIPSCPSTSSLSNAAPSASQLFDHEILSMRSRIRQLEDKLSNITQETTTSPAKAANTHIDMSPAGTAGTITVHQKSSSFGEAKIVRNIMYKTRIFGRSHWMNGTTQFLDNFKIIEPHMRREISKAASDLQTCKYLAKIIKLQRTPPWPLTPSADMPPKDVADQLVDSYLRTIETFYRIIHIPSFKKDYDFLWVSDNKPDPGFMVQVKLILAIGATLYDDQFTLRPSAIRWVFEAHAYLSAPAFKSQLSIDFLQTNLIFLIARETVAVGGELIWISAGSLLRSAVYMGLHRDPDTLSKMPVFTAEIRRRLWNTVLEITLQSSMDSGGPPSISLDDFNTAPPSNLNDDQLMADDVTTRPEHEYTQASIALSLRKTFPVRLAIAKFLNDVSSKGSYEETLRLDTELRTAYKPLYQSIQVYSTGHSLSRFQTCMVEMTFCRYLSSLHIPFLNSSLHDVAYAFSRKTMIDTALKIWGAINPSSATVAYPSRLSTASLNQDDVARLTIGSSGFFRTTAFQASFVAAAELRTQLHENENLGPAPLRLDLLSVIDDAKKLALRCIEAGETNIKNYLLICVISAQIDRLRRGSIPNDEFPQLLIEAADSAVARCLSILERNVAQDRDDAAHRGDGFGLNSLDISDDWMEGWDFMIPDPQFDFDYEELVA